MGIFGVNMPMLYGEGRRSFIRLQEIIMTKSTDHTIFAWEGVEIEQSRESLLANSPPFFEESGEIIRAPFGGTMPFAMTNNGYTCRCEYRK
jgi:hypothetical protein